MLTVTLAVGCFALVATVVGLAVHPSGLPATRQNMETALYVTGFLVIVPAAAVAGPRLADRIAAESPAGLSPLAALLAAGLAGAVGVGRVVGSGGVRPALAAFAAWWLVAAALLAWPRVIERVSRLEVLLWTLAGGLVLGAVLCFARPRSLSVLALVLGVPVVAGLVALYARGRSLRLPRPAAVAADVGVIGLLLLAVPDVVIFGTPQPGESFFTNQAAIAQFHQNFVLGPANVVLHGGAMLVDTASQYGVGEIYFLVGWFHVAPIGYGTLGFLDAALFALLYAAGYAVLRLAGASRALAAGALAVAVVVLIYNLLYPVGSLPAQHGPLRFGMPMLVVLAATLGARLPGRAGVAGTAELAVVGLSSIWSLEVFAYTTGTFAAITAFRVAAPSAGGWRRPLLRRLGAALAACLAAHLILVAGTLIGSGKLPDYGWYGDYLGGFLFGGVGEITFDFTRWSPGLPVAVAYAASAIALILVIRRRPGLLQVERPALVALCGTTAYGIALYSYFVNRSADHILPYVSFPALVAGALWLSLLLREGSPRVRLGGLAFALALALLLTSVAWSSIGDRFPDTALGRAVPGGNSLGSALDRLWHLPPIDPRTPEAERLLVPAAEPVVVVLPPDLETESLIRSDQTNRLPIAFAPEDGFISDRTVPRLRRAIARLRPGTTMLTDTTALRLLARLRSEPARDPVKQPIPSPAYAPIQEWTLREIGRRFRLRVVRRGRQGLLLIRLVSA